MDFIRRNIKFVYILVLPVYFYIIQNSILNKHTHVYSNGIVVTHSHGLDDENQNPLDHQHSKSEINLFSDLNIDYHFSSEIVGVEVKSKNFSQSFFVVNENSNSSCHLLFLIPRAPPVLQII